jgi:hypothetical protein
MVDTFNVDETKKGISGLAIFIIIILVAAIVGGGIWAYYHYKIIPNLQKTITTVPLSSPSKTNSSTSDQIISTEQPTDFVSNFISEYKKCTGVDTGCKNVMEKYATSALVFKDLGNSDWLGLQDTPDGIKSETFTQQSYEDGSATIIMQAKYGVSDFNRQFVLVTVGNQWKIASIEAYNPLPNP